jgi:hypothetical protein
MVEATHNVQQTQLHASMSRAVSCLAQQQAIKAVKHQLRGRGLKVHSFAHREIVAT